MDMKKIYNTFYYKQEEEDIGKMENFTRLASFVSWKHNVSAVLLANAGFTCSNDKAVCTSCNVTLSDEQLGKGDFKTYHRDDCTFCSTLPLKFSLDYFTLEGRLATYTNWQSFMSPNDLAKCGFYYTGYSDKVECAFCRGILHEWCVNDIPLNEHLRHFPHCHFAQKLSLEGTPQRIVSAPMTQQETIQSLIEDNTRLKESRQCKVCMDSLVDTVFLPCGHLVTCDKCSMFVSECPICRTHIKSTLKTFIP